MSLLFYILFIDGADPFCPGRLDFLTEVLVVPPIFNRKPLDVPQEKFNFKESSPFLNYFNKDSNSRKPKEQISSDRKLSSIVWRLIEFDTLECLKNSNLKYAFHVFVYKQSLPYNLRSLNSKDNFLLTILEYIKPPVQNNFLAEEPQNAKNLYVRLMVIEDFIDNTNGVKTNKSNLYCSKEIFNYFSANVGSKVALELTEFKTTNSSREIEIQCSKVHQKDSVEKFKNFVNDNVDQFKYVLINTDVVLRLDDSLTCVFNIENEAYCLVDSDVIRNRKIKSVEALVSFNKKSDNNLDKNHFTEFSNYNKIINDCVSLLKKGYNNGNLENILITGTV